MLNRLNLYFSIFFFCVSLIFYYNPSSDIEIAKIFYHDVEGFYYAHHWLVKLIFRTVPIITLTYGIALTAWTLILIKKGNNLYKIFLHISIIFSLILGSGALVNLGLKDNFGRARPKQIKEFGAQKEFSKVYQMASQCYKNCSFSSGHAAAAYSITTVAFLVPKNRQIITYMLGIIYGTVVGFGRIVQGGHFISDITTSAWIVLLVTYILISLFLYIVGFKNLDQGNTD